MRESDANMTPKTTQQVAPPKPVQRRLLILLLTVLLLLDVGFGALPTTQYRSRRRQSSKNVLSESVEEPDEALEEQSAMPAAFAGKESFNKLESQAETKTGQRIWVSTNGMPVLDEDGNLLGYRGNDMDITERKRAEEELWRTLADTERMNRLMSRLEDRVLELKKEVNELLKNRGESKSMGA